MRWLWALGSVLVAAVLLAFLASPALGWFAGMAGGVAVLVAWRAGVAGNTSRNWAEGLYGSSSSSSDSDYASLMGRHLGRRRR